MSKRCCCIAWTADSRLSLWQPSWRSGREDWMEVPLGLVINQSDKFSRIVVWPWPVFMTEQWVEFFNGLRISEYFTLCCSLTLRSVGRWLFVISYHNNNQRVARRETTTLATMKSVPRYSRKSDRKKTPWPSYRDATWSGMDMFAVHQVWPKPSCKAQWRGKKTRQTEKEVGRQSGNGQAWSSPSPRGQWRTGENGGNWLNGHLWCPNDPCG